MADVSKQEQVIDWALTPLFIAVLNSTQEWNTRGDHKLFYPLEVNYVIDMVRASQEEFKMSEMMRPFHLKAR